MGCRYMCMNSLPCRARVGYCEQTVLLYSSISDNLICPTVLRRIVMPIETVEVDGTEVEVTVENGYASAKIVPDFKSHVEDIADSFDHVVSTRGEGDPNHHVAIVAGTPHGSMRTDEWFDTLLADSRTEIRYVCAITEQDLGENGYENLDEDWNGRAMILVEDTESSEGIW